VTLMMTNLLLVSSSIHLGGVLSMMPLCMNKAIETGDFCRYLCTGCHELRSYALAPHKVDLENTNLVYSVAFEPHSTRPHRFMMEFDREATRLVCQKISGVHLGVESPSVDLKVKIVVRHYLGGEEITIDKDTKGIKSFIVYGFEDLLTIDLGTLNPADFKWFFTDKIEVEVQILNVPSLLRGLSRQRISLNIVEYPPLQ